MADSRAVRKARIKALEVEKERLLVEYTLPVDFEISRFSVCRWIASADKLQLERFVEAHRGEIRVESEVGVGSRFTFWIPVQSSATAVSASADAQSLTASDEPAA